MNHPWTPVKKDIITVNDLSPAEVDQIFDLADRSENLTFPRQAGLTACVSFEGNSTRTRATFTKALVDLGITPIDVPNLLKTGEAVHHLAGTWIHLPGLCLALLSCRRLSHHVNHHINHQVM